MEACLNSIANQDYPKDLLEVIVVDDHSEDSTAEIARGFASSNFRLISLSDLKTADRNKGKKFAIDAGISAASGEIIVTTDADCEHKPSWLRSIASYFESEDVYALTGPVQFRDRKGIFSSFQIIEFMSMIGVTGAGIKMGEFHLANGANFSYKRDAYFAVEGFKDINHLASGDDVMLMQKIASNFDKKVAFLKSKDAIVYTDASRSIRDFVSQRLRWATKTSSYREKSVTATWALVWMVCAFIVLNFILLFFKPVPTIYFLVALLLIKLISDFYFLGSIARFFGLERLIHLPGYVVSSILQILYVLSIGLSALFVRKYSWKGRRTS